jgi:hypothetical protein
MSKARKRATCRYALLVLPTVAAIPSYVDTEIGTRGHFTLRADQTYLLVPYMKIHSIAVASPLIVVAALWIDPDRKDLNSRHRFCREGYQFAAAACSLGSCLSFAENNALCRIASRLLFGTNVAHDERLQGDGAARPAGVE